MCIVFAQSGLWAPCGLPAGKRFDHEPCRTGAKTSQLFNSGGCISIFSQDLQVLLADKRVFPLYQELHLAALLMSKAFSGPHLLEASVNNSMGQNPND